VGGLEKVDTGYSLSASRFLVCREAQNYGSQKKVQNSRGWERRDGVDGPSLPKLSISTIKPVEAIDACLDHDLFQELIESTNT